MSTNPVIILQAKSAGFSNLRYTQHESASAGCSARFADDIDTEGVRVVQQTRLGWGRGREHQTNCSLHASGKERRRPALKEEADEPGLGHRGRAD